MKRPIESDYTSLTAYTRALEEYCNAFAQPATVQEPVAWEQFYPELGIPFVTQEELEELLKKD